MLPITDDEAPVITCPDNLASVEVAIGMNQAAVVWSPLPSANDTVDGILASDRIICVDDSGNQVASGVDFGIGLTTIICTAQDAASNEATCDFNITTGNHNINFGFYPYTLMCVSMILSTYPNHRHIHGVGFKPTASNSGQSWWFSWYDTALKLHRSWV